MPEVREPHPDKDDCPILQQGPVPTAEPEGLPILREEDRILDHDGPCTFGRRRYCSQCFLTKGERDLLAQIKIETTVILNNTELARVNEKSRERIRLRQRQRKRVCESHQSWLTVELFKLVAEKGLTDQDISSMIRKEGGYRISAAAIKTYRLGYGDPRIKAAEAIARTVGYEFDLIQAAPETE
jgi:hypothetical protein